MMKDERDMRKEKRAAASEKMPDKTTIGKSCHLDSSPLATLAVVFPGGRTFFFAILSVVILIPNDFPHGASSLASAIMLPRAT